MPSLRRAFDWTFRSRADGRIVIAQWPNVPLAVFLVARGIDLVAGPHGRVHAALSWIGTLALVWWALDELIRGVNPWRRALGVGGLAVVVAGMLAR